MALELNGAHRRGGRGWANEEEGSVLVLAAKKGHVGWGLCMDSRAERLWKFQKRDTWANGDFNGKAKV